MTGDNPLLPPVTKHSRWFPILHPCLALKLGFKICFIYISLCQVYLCFLKHGANTSCPLVKYNITMENAPFIDGENKDLH